MFVNVEEFVGIVDKVSDSVHCQYNDTFLLAFKDIFVWDLLDDLVVMLLFLLGKVVIELLVESELIERIKLLVDC
jgi:hypothetical protein